jgi:hypothetical protein
MDREAFVKALENLLFIMDRTYADARAYNYVSMLHAMLTDNAMLQIHTLDASVVNQIIREINTYAD